MKLALPLLTHLSLKKTIMKRGRKEAISVNLFWGGKEGTTRSFRMNDDHHHPCKRTKVDLSYALSYPLSISSRKKRKKGRKHLRLFFILRPPTSSNKDSRQKKKIGRRRALVSCFLDFFFQKSEERPKTALLGDAN